MPKKKIIVDEEMSDYTDGPTCEVVRSAFIPTRKLDKRLGELIIQAINEVLEPLIELDLYENGKMSLCITRDMRSANVGIDIVGKRNKTKAELEDQKKEDGIQRKYALINAEKHLKTLLKEFPELKSKVK